MWTKDVAYVISRGAAQVGLNRQAGGPQRLEALVRQDELLVPKFFRLGLFAIGDADDQVVDLATDFVEPMLAFGGIRIEDDVLVTESGYKYLLALLFTLGYGLLDEWHQTFVVGRFGTLTDVGFDVIGAVIGLLIYRIWFTVEKKKVD